MKEELIKAINEKCPYDQGIFFQPFGIPDGIETHVVYSRVETGGTSGGNCWNDDEARPYVADEAEEEPMKVLDILLEEIAPKITYLQYKKIQKLIHSNEHTEWQYYGNSTDYKIEYILLPELENLLAQFAI